MEAPRSGVRNRTDVGDFISCVACAALVALDLIDMKDTMVRTIKRVIARRIIEWL
jgi:hypothetical protein